MLAGDAVACVCAEQPIGERLDDSDVAFVGRIVSERDADRRGAPIRVLEVAVEQRVKGEIEGTVLVESPRGSDCDLVLEENRSVGLLLTRGADGQLIGSECSIVRPGDLVAAGGEPRGGAIKLVIGLLILALVLGWALRRRARGARPSLPGPPET